MSRIVIAGTSIALVVIVGLLVVRSAGNGTPSELEVGVAAEPTSFDPVRAGEPTPDGFRQVLARDQIEPIYQPEFTDAGDVDWPDDTLVLGVAGATEAKAYPITHLNRHEMVNDQLDGEPILATW